MAATAANVQAHVLDDAEHGDVHLLEHLEPFAGIRERDVLRRRDDDGAADGHALRERELDVARAGRHVDDEVVEIAPARLRQQLVQRRRHHRPAPRHRLLLVDEKADRHGLDTVRHERLEQLAVPRLGPAPREPQHARLARAVDIGVEQPDARAFGRQAPARSSRRRSTCRHRPCPKPPRSGCGLQATASGRAARRAPTIELTIVNSIGAPSSAAAQCTRNASMSASPLAAERKAEPEGDVPTRPAALEIERRRQGRPSGRPVWGNDERAERFLQIRAGGMRSSTATRERARL